MPGYLHRITSHPLSGRAHLAIVAALVGATLLISCGDDSSDDSSSAPPSQAAQETGDAQGTDKPSDPGKVEDVAENLEAPWSIAFYGDTPLVSERDSARILELDDQGKSREVATIDGVTPNGEAGLLGIAVQDRQLYTYFTAEGGNRIERHEIKGEPGSLSLGPAEPVLDGLPSGSIHNGGRIAFGPDGMLYATVGETGDTSMSQDRESLGGKILRMTPQGKVPPDNPFEGSLVYSYGHRNPQGIAWRGGTMFASEFGQDTWDELNVIEPGGNYGWPEVEGKAGQEGFIDPVQQWHPADASPSGIAISGDEINIANLRGERLRVVPIDDLGNSTERFNSKYGRLRDVVNAPDGSLWMLTNNTDGRGSPSAGDDRIIRVPVD